ncbi:MAG: adenylate/guanylate cyclase domain-containing protein [Thermodesulfobacteriota bacterium]
MGNKHSQASILVVDDVNVDREILRGLLIREGYQVQLAEDGLKALELLLWEKVDLVLLDILMPRLDGYQFLEKIKSDPDLKYMPVIMISAVDEIDSVIRCIEMGAEDYLTKPFNRVLLKVRIEKCLEKKRQRDQEQRILAVLQEEQEKSENLLLNIFPKSIADRLKKGQRTIVEHFTDVTVMFADIVGFTQLSARLDPQELIEFLNDIFSKFDQLAHTHGLEKIKTIGDSYMVVGGIPDPDENHARSIAEMALDMMDVMSNVRIKTGETASIRIGINTGPVRVGVIGTSKFSYDLWGDTVNIASRMESQGLPGMIQVTESTYKHLSDYYLFEERRDQPDFKGKGKMSTYLLKGRKEF